MSDKKIVKCKSCGRRITTEADVALGTCVGCRANTRMSSQQTSISRPQASIVTPLPRRPSVGPGAEWEELIGEGIELVQAEKRNLWAQGDLAVRVLIGRKSEALEEFTLRIGADYETFQEYRRTAIAFPPESRRLSLSFTHHKAIAAREDRHEWIARAATEKWSRPQMLDSIKAQIRPIPTLVGIESEILDDTPSTITNHDTAFVSGEEPINDLLERVPDLMETPVEQAGKVPENGQLPGRLGRLADLLAEVGEAPLPGEDVVDAVIRIMRHFFGLLARS